MRRMMLTDDELRDLEELATVGFDEATLRLVADVRALRRAADELAAALEANRRDFVSYNEEWERINMSNWATHNPVWLITPHPFTLAVKEIDAALAAYRAVKGE